MQVNGIEVVYLDGNRGRVGNDVLDILIATEKIKSFRRRDGWVDIFNPTVKLRDYCITMGYQGIERRAPWPDAR